MSLDSTLPLIVGTVLVATLVVFIIVFVILYSRAQLKFRLERQHFQQALLEAEVEIRKETLNNVALDLHDNIGQIASLIKINLNLISSELKAKDQKHLEESTQLLRHLIADIKSLTNNLMDQEINPNYLLEQMQRDIQRIQQTGIIDLKLETSSKEIKLAPDISIFLYRMFQEMINNVVKHSKATAALVKLKKNDTSLFLILQDNGIGFPALKNNKGNGLNNIKERCKMIEADLTIDSNENKGTFIQIIYPFK